VRFLRNHRTLSKVSCFLCLVAILAAIPAAISPQGSGDKILSNYELLEKVSASAVRELMENMPMTLDGGVVFLKKVRGVGEIDFVFENVMYEEMKDAGIRISVTDPQYGITNSNSKSYKLSYQIVRMSLKYTKISRNYWVGAKEVDRAAEVDVFVQLIDVATGDVVWVGDANKREKNVIAYSLLDSVEDEEYAFCKPPRNEFRWSRLIEPLAVAGIITGLVFLFFSNQSEE